MESDLCSYLDVRYHRLFLFGALSSSRHGQLYRTGGKPSGINSAFSLITIVILFIAASSISENLDWIVDFLRLFAEGI